MKKRYGATGALWAGPRGTGGTLARAFVAKAALDLPTTRQLLDGLSTYWVLRRSWGGSEVPDESTSRGRLPSLLNGLGGTGACGSDRGHPRGTADWVHISRDPTEIEAREAPVKVEKPAPTPKLRGRPKKGEVRERKPTRLERPPGAKCPDH